jgi:hypothetical protein
MKFPKVTQVQFDILYFCFRCWGDTAVRCNVIQNGDSICLLTGAPGLLVRGGKTKVARWSVRMASDICSGREDSAIEKHMLAVNCRDIHWCRIAQSIYTTYSFLFACLCWLVSPHCSVCSQPLSRMQLSANCPTTHLDRKVCGTRFRHLEFGDAHKVKEL